MRFTIVTPSLNQLDWLTRCVLSVVDQASEAIQVEHIVQDAGSASLQHQLELFEKQGLRRFVPSRESPALPNEVYRLRTSVGYCLRVFCEDDRGMYDAINRGMQRATGDILAHLNCDEQYLPGALAKVAKDFEGDPAGDIFLYGAVMLSADGSYICQREPVRQSVSHIQLSHLHSLTAATFYRSRVMKRPEMAFSVEHKASADADWMIRAIQSGLRVRCRGGLTSAFFDTGENLGLSAVARDEFRRRFEACPRWKRRLVAFMKFRHLMRRLLAGHYARPPFAYEVYTAASGAVRRRFHVEKPTGLHRGYLGISRDRGQLASG